MSTNRVDNKWKYLSYISMGGCSALGMGLPRANVFAAILVEVPAGTDFATLRMGFPDAHASNATESEREAWIEGIPDNGLPDPSVDVANQPRSAY